MLSNCFTLEFPTVEMAPNIFGLDKLKQLSCYQKRVLHLKNCKTEPYWFFSYLEVLSLRKHECTGTCKMTACAAYSKVEEFLRQSSGG
jgi:hypothetical protein